MRFLWAGVPVMNSVLRASLIVALAFWAAAALLLAISPAILAGEVPVAFIAYWIIAIFAAAALTSAITRTAGAMRAFWIILGAGVLLRFAGSASLAGFRLFDLTPPLLAPHDVVYGVSSILLFIAILWLVARTARSITLLATLDSLGVMFFTGLVSWHFALGPAAPWTGWDSLNPLLLARSGPVFDVGLLCLALVVASSNRRLARCAFSLAGAFGAFLVADGLYLGLRTYTLYETGGWPELFWALGIAFIGLAALDAGVGPGSVAPLAVSPRVVAVFWFSPLSPAVQLAFLLAWGAVRPPLPPYALWGGTVIALYLALRISMGTYASQRLRGEAERRAKVSERDRISEDLHDTLKQCVHSVPLMLAAYRKTREKDPEAAEDILDRALQTSGEASYRISGPVRELQVGGAASALDIRALLDQLLQDVERSFGIKVRRDVQAPLDGLSPERLAAAHRITSEALWNAARHSGARNIRFETRRVGTVFLVKVRDDGRGFDAEEQGAGMGLPLMRRRAEEASGKLDVVSRPGAGTTVQIRFDDE